MNHHRLAGRWKQIRGAARLHWGRLTGNAALVRSGARERLVGSLQAAYGAATDHAAQRARAWQARAPLRR